MPATPRYRSVSGPEEVFISYSRKDKEFVGRLYEALKSRDREAWVDWEDIRPIEEFMDAIYGAIEGANTFVFVLTPDSVASVVCRREIAHAAANNKRIVPIVVRDVNADTVPKALAKLNWIFCRETDDFEKATDALISALDTDLKWMQAHTRLLTRAIEWENNGNNKSFLLRGKHLRAAKRWLAEAGAQKERQPTSLQTEYIIASRKAARRRPLITLVGFVVAPLIVLGAIGITFLAYLAGRGNHLDKESKAYADTAILAIVRTWDEKELMDRASPEFKQAVTADQLGRLFRWASRLGRLQEWRPAQGQSLRFFTPQSGTEITAKYTAKAQFEKGEAIITLFLIKHGDQWHIVGYSVESPQLLVPP